MKKINIKSLRRIHFGALIELSKRHPVVLIIGGVVLVAVIIVLIELTGHKQSTDSFTATGLEETSSLQTLPPQPARLTSPQVEETPEPQSQQPSTQSGQQPAPQNEEEKAQKQREMEITQLEAEQQSLTLQIAQLRSDEQERLAWHNEEIQLLQTESNQIQNLGSTLQRVLKTPREIRVLATDLQQQANGLRSQAQVQSQRAGKTSVQTNISTAKANTLMGMASNLDDIALKLQRTQGDPSRVKISALEIQRKGEDLQRIVNIKRSQEVPEDSQLIALERKYNDLKNKIQELHREQVAGTQD